MIGIHYYVCQWASPAARMRPAQWGPRTVYCFSSSSSSSSSSFLKHNRVYMRANGLNIYIYIYIYNVESIHESQLIINKKKTIYIYIYIMRRVYMRVYD